MLVGVTLPFLKDKVPGGRLKLGLASRAAAVVRGTSTDNPAWPLALTHQHYNNAPSTGHSLQSVVCRWLPHCAGNCSVEQKY